jgi:hypothetical protein
MIAGGEKEALDVMLQQVPNGRLGRSEEIPVGFGVPEPALQHEEGQPE